MKIKYQWRVLTDDGLLKRPDDWSDGYYAVNFSRDYISEQAAFEEFGELITPNSYKAPRNLVLVKTYERD